MALASEWVSEIGSYHGNYKHFFLSLCVFRRSFVQRPNAFECVHTTCGSVTRWWCARAPAKRLQCNTIHWTLTANWIKKRKINARNTRRMRFATLLTGVKNTGDKTNTHFVYNCNFFFFVRFWPSPELILMVIAELCFTSVQFCVRNMRAWKFCYTLFSLTLLVVVVRHIYIFNCGPDLA